jgi:hypothetical protein
VKQIGAKSPNKQKLWCCSALGINKNRIKGHSMCVWIFGNLFGFGFHLYMCTNSIYSIFSFAKPFFLSPPRVVLILSLLCCNTFRCPYASFLFFFPRTYEHICMLHLRWMNKKRV